MNDQKTNYVIESHTCLQSELNNRMIDRLNDRSTERFIQVDQTKKSNLRPKELSIVVHHIHYYKLNVIIMTFVVIVTVYGL